MNDKELYKNLGMLTKSKENWESNIDYIGGLLQNQTVKITAKVLWMLGEMGLQYPEKIGLYVESISSFMNSDYALLRERALNALGRIGRGDYRLVEDYMSDIKKRAKDEEPAVRLAFIWACENIATNSPELFENDMPMFACMLEDENKRVRIESPEIFRVLGKRKPSYIIPYITLLQYMAEHDEDEVVRIHAKGAIKTVLKSEKI